MRRHSVSQDRGRRRGAYRKCEGDRALPVESPETRQSQSTTATAVAGLPSSQALDDRLKANRSFPLSTFATHCSSLMRSSWMGVLLGTDAQEVGGFFLDVCRPCGDCEGEVGREGGRDGVFGDGGEVVKQGVEAVDGETIVGSAGGLLGEGGGRSLSLCDRALAE